jgi:hypothetical protein
LAWFASSVLDPCSYYSPRIVAMGAPNDTNAGRNRAHHRRGIRRHGNHIRSTLAETVRRGMLTIALILLTAALWSEGKPRDWKESAEIVMILSVAEADAGLPRGLAHCVAYSESRFKPTARSRIVGGYRSCGIMQLYRKYLYGPEGLASRFADDPLTFQWDDPAENAQVGCRYLAYLIQRFGGSVYLGVLAYNAGPGTIERMKEWSDIPKRCVKYADDVLALLDRWDETWGGVE